MIEGLTIPPDAWPYLRAQKGALANIREPMAWTAAYIASLNEQFESMRPYLPARCRRSLDVGSGLGGIDIALFRHYRGAVDLWLVDGMDDPPVVRRHAATFNHMAVASRFLHANGVEWELLSGPDILDPRATDDQAPVDVVMSFGSWCFHYAPSVYLSGVRAVLNPEGATLVLEVRRDRAEWLADLESAFGRGRLIAEAPKWRRFVFLANG